MTLPIDQRIKTGVDPLKKSSKPGEQIWKSDPLKAVRGVASLSLILHRKLKPKAKKPSLSLLPSFFSEEGVSQYLLMALSSPQLQRFLSNRIDCYSGYKTTNKKSINVKGRGNRCCSAIAIDAPSSLSSGVAGIRWGSTQLQGPREEMEDDVVIVRSDDLDGFSYAAVFDGHAGFSSVKFLRF